MEDWAIVALFGTLWNWLSVVFAADSAPAWVQAVGSVLAILVAVGIPAWQRSITLHDAKTEKARQDKEHVRRLIAGVRAEVSAAVEATSRQRTAAESSLAALGKAKENGQVIVDRGPFTSVILTDAIIYRQVASELGRLPPEIIRRIVMFYTLTLDLGRLVGMAASGVASSETLADLTPRVQMNGALLIAALDKFQRSDFAPDADLNLEREEVKALAERVGYPLEAIMRERGVTA